MEKSQMKNIVVLKNLPSNLIEEAFVIVKSKKTAKTLEYIDKKEDLNKKEDAKNTNDYIIREAESVISSYIKVVENKEKKQDKVSSNKKYKILKIYSIVVTLILAVCVIL
jgi:DNA polymerase III delta prime subunit